MIKNPLLGTLFAADRSVFYEAFSALLGSKGFSKYTIWEIQDNTVCKPVAGKDGVMDGIFDIYDLGYAGGDYSSVAGSLNCFGERCPVYAVVFCRDGERLSNAVTFHTPLAAGEELRFLRAAAPFIAMHEGYLAASERQLELFMDYQKKIDFIKESGGLLKVFSPKDVITAALNFFFEAFHAEAACVIIDKDDFFAGMGLIQEDLREAAYVDGISLGAYIKGHSDALYIVDNLYSEKYNIKNLFLIKDPVSEAVFVLFNVSGDVIPDKELSELITQLVSRAVENAQVHEQETALKIEQAEMEQTVVVISRFVSHEIELRRGSAGGIDAYAVNFPARSIGGDYTNLVDYGDFVFACLGDVCGKGFSAATLTVMLATIVDSGFFIEQRDLGGLTNFINNYLLSKNFADRFITGFSCIYDKKTNIMTYASCGHEPALLLKGDGFQELLTHNLPMGIQDDEYEVRQAEIAAGDLLFIYSDGVTEYISESGLKEELIRLRDLSPKEIARTLYTVLVGDPARQRDDFSCTVMKF